MFLVVPTKEPLRKRPTVLNAPEAVRELRTIFHGAELTLRVRIVIRDMRTAMGLGDSQVRQEEGYRLGAHRGAAIGMQRELTRQDALLVATVLDEPLGQFGTLAHRDHPAGDVAAKNIEDDVEVEVGPLGRSEQLGDVPAPELIGSRRQELGLAIGRMGQLVAAFAGFPLVRTGEEAERRSR